MQNDQRESVDVHNSKKCSTSTGTQGVYKNPRLMHVCTTIVGSTVYLQTKDGRVWEGIFKTFDPKFTICLSFAVEIDPKLGTKECFYQALSSGKQVREQAFFTIEDIVRIAVIDIDLSYATKDAALDKFTTDSDISGFNATKPGQFRELETWQDDDNETTVDESLLSLDELGSANKNGAGKNTSRGWGAQEMFRYNEKVHKVNSTYDDKLIDYTIALNDEKSEEWQRKQKRAAAIAQEIELNPKSQNRLAKEDGSDDEEEKFSAVVRPNQQSNQAPPKQQKSQQNQQPQQQQSQSPQQHKPQQQSQHQVPQHQQQQHQISHQPQPYQPPPHQQQHHQQSQGQPPHHQQHSVQQHGQHHHHRDSQPHHHQHHQQHHHHHIQNQQPHHHPHPIQPAKNFRQNPRFEPRNRIDSLKDFGKSFTKSLNINQPTQAQPQNQSHQHQQSPSQTQGPMNHQHQHQSPMQQQQQHGPQSQQQQHHQQQHQQPPQQQQSHQPHQAQQTQPNLATQQTSQQSPAQAQSQSQQTPSPAKPNQPQPSPAQPQTQTSSQPHSQTQPQSQAQTPSQPASQGQQPSQSQSEIAKKSTLNPNAKEFKPEFKPRSPATAHAPQPNGAAIVAGVPGSVPVSVGPANSSPMPPTGHDAYYPQVPVFHHGLSPHQQQHHAAQFMPNHPHMHYQNPIHYMQPPPVAPHFAPAQQMPPRGYQVRGGYQNYPPYWTGPEGIQWHLLVNREDAGYFPQPHWPAN